MTAARSHVGDPVDRLLELLLSVRRQGSSWRALCPAHEDRNPSLSISRADTGNALVNCQAGCSIEDVLAAVGLRTADLFVDRQDRPRDVWRGSGDPVQLPRPATGRAEQRPQRRTVATYSYRDEDGRELFQKLRYDPKDFRQRRRDGTGGWSWSLGDTRRVLYRLPEVVAAVKTRRTVWLVEGEKDADRLAEMGEVGTCNFDGAAKAGQRTKWRSEYGDSLTGAHVVIVADRDDAGRAHAEAAYDDLLGKAASVRIVKPATEGEHDDLSDHLDAGHSLGQLVPVREQDAPTDEGPRPLVPARRPAEFPVEALPAVLADYVLALSRQTQTPPDMAAMCVLGAVAACAGGRAVVEARPGWREPVNVYALVVMPPASRKSAVITDSTRPLYRAEAELTSKVDGDIVEAETRRDIAQKIAEKARRDAVSARPDTRDAKLADAISAATAAAAITIPARPRLVADDATPEAAVSLLAEQQGCIAFISAEGGLFDVMAGRYSDKIPNLDVWLKGHAGDPMRVDRKGRPSERIDNPALTLLLTAQPTVLREIARNGQFRGRGLLARFLYAIPASNVGHRQIGAAPVPPQVSEAYGERITELARLLGHYNEPAVIPLDPDAAQLMLDIERRIEPQLAPDGPLGHIAEWGGKLGGAILRIAGLLHLAEDPAGGERPISADTLQRADSIGVYLTEHASAALSRLGDAATETAAEFLLDYLLSVDDLQEFTIKKLMDRLSRGRFPTSESVAGAVAVLAEHGWVVEQPAPARKGPGRRPSPRFRLHPDAHTADR
ncbi:DUF3987 domain-containing protein [Pseudonocardia sp. ICBG601]|uniref:DUF3987 domain-containing protein n=1 Tax=Pseudonocardia sp. ICBG601 TaxID=2846759 RepID=UPI001CF6A617|nr:DUF3987 domain-containing protein [Pseudonocardia sp. ICBG601]